MRTLSVRPRLFCPTFWGQYNPEADCMSEQHQYGRLPAERQGEVRYVLTPSCNVPFEPF